MANQFASKSNENGKILAAAGARAVTQIRATQGQCTTPPPCLTIFCRSESPERSKKAKKAKKTKKSSKSKKKKDKKKKDKKKKDKKAKKKKQSEAKESKTVPPETKQVFDDRLNVPILLSNNRCGMLEKIIKKCGHGRKPIRGQTVTLACTGYLKAGKKQVVIL